MVGGGGYVNAKVDGVRVTQEEDEPNERYNNRKVNKMTGIVLEK